MGKGGGEGRGGAKGSHQLFIELLLNQYCIFRDKLLVVVIVVVVVVVVVV